MKRWAIAGILLALTLAAVNAALVSTSTNTVLGGNVQSPVYSTTSAAFQEVWTPTTFETNVYLHDSPDIPLHLRLPATSNTTVAALNGLRGEVSIVPGTTNVTVTASNGQIAVGVEASSVEVNTNAIVSKAIEAVETNDFSNITLGGKTISSWDSFISKWPYHYELNTSISFTNMPPTNSAGLFRSLDGMWLQSKFENLNISALGDGYDDGGMFEPAPNIEIHSEHGNVNITATNGVTITTSNLVLNGVGITNWSDIGGGYTPATRLTATNSNANADDFLIWLDTRSFSSSDSVTLSLVDMDADGQTIVVRRLGNTGTATIARGTNTWTLGNAGDGVTVDWLKAATNWFWRTF